MSSRGRRLIYVQHRLEYIFKFWKYKILWWNLSILLYYLTLQGVFIMMFIVLTLIHTGLIDEIPVGWSMGYKFIKALDYGTLSGSWLGLISANVWDACPDDWLAQFSLTNVHNDDLNIYISNPVTVCPYFCLFCGGVKWSDNACPPHVA